MDQKPNCVGKNLLHITVKISLLLS